MYECVTTKAYKHQKWKQVVGKINTYFHLKLINTHTHTYMCDAHKMNETAKMT